MRPEIWKEFMWLQTDCAYPHGPHQVAPCHVARARELNWLGAHRPQDVLIVGPGTNTEVEAVDDWLKPRRLVALTALESERESLALCRGRVPPEVVVGDMHDCTLPSGSFDFIFASNVLEHSPAPLIALFELRRLLRSQGVLYTIVPTFETTSGGSGPFHVSCLGPELWRELMRKAGLPCGTFRYVEEVPFAELETYYHFYAVAGALPEPYHALFMRLARARGEHFVP